MTHLKDEIGVKKSWEKYWQNYHGVTKIGAWSQKQSLNRAFLIIRESALGKNAKIIDVGCGEGRTLQAFRKKGYKNAIGIDNTRESLRICQQKGFKIQKDVFLVDAQKTGFKNDEFELVFSEGLLEHFKDPSKIINQMARISGKYVLLVQPNHYSLYGKALAVLGHLLRHNIREYPLTRDYFIKKFKDRGFYLKTGNFTPLREFFILLFEKKP